MLYKDTVSKDTPIIVKGWAEIASAVRGANLSLITNQAEKENVNAAKQLIEQIELSNSLEETLAKTHTGAVVLALKRGDDPSKVKDPGSKFDVTDISGKQKGKAKLPPEWERSLCAMYTRGLEQVPILGAKTVDALDSLIKANPIDPSTPGDENTKLDPKAASLFLKEMKACKVKVEDKAAPAGVTVAKQAKLGTESMDEMKSIYGKLPDLAGADLDPEVKAVSSEYGAAPAPTKGKPGSGDDDDGDAATV